MLFWIIAALMTATTVAYLLTPLLRPGAPTAPRADYDLHVYRDQLAELDRDLARGTIDAAQAAAARAEIGRLMLAAAEASAAASPAAVSPATPPRSSRVLALALTVLLPLGALAVYLPMGHFDLPSQPFAGR